MANSLNLATLRVAVLSLFVLLAGCATFSTPFAKPDVKLVSVKLLPSEGFEQRLAIKLRVVNPNAATLSLVGMQYSLGLQGYDLVSGVTRDIAPIPGYAETDVQLLATVDWINGLRLLQSVLAKPDSSVSYELKAKLDPGRLLPAFHISEQGVIDLVPAE